LSYGELLLEIGCEEIPARYVADLSHELCIRVEDYLRSNRIPYNEFERPLHTPRRLIVVARGLAAKQTDTQGLVLGPPKRVAFDAHGNATQAAKSFAERNKVEVGELIIEETTKGEYLAFRRIEKGKSTQKILNDGLASVILSVPLPRSMYWQGKQGPRFIRPIRWICCVLNGKPLRFSFGAIKAGGHSYGHRILGPKKVIVRSFEEYRKILSNAGVILAPEEREEKICRDMDVLVSKNGANLLEDNDLLKTHVRLSEHPTPIIGSFNISFLKLPQEILVMVMRDHQKYFSLRDAANDERLLPKFVAIIDNVSDRKGFIRKSHERVLRARFADAQFFWESDLKIPMPDRHKMLEKVVFQEGLGTYAQKSSRLGIVAGGINASAKLGLKSDLVEEAAQLCKCDLTTQMVKEFPELQGIVGGLYLRAQNDKGGPHEVADAVYDHYRPETIESPVPRSKLGALISIADKVDSLTGSFSTGHRPTGSKDPFGLRRLVHGILKVILEFRFNLDVRGLIVTSLDEHSRRTLRNDPNDPILEGILQFVRGSAQFVFEFLYGKEGAGISREEIISVLNTDSWDFSDMKERIFSLDRIRKRENFDSLAVSFKRIKNIIQKSKESVDGSEREVREGLFQQEEEAALFVSIRELKNKIKNSGDHPNYDLILKSIAGMRPVVDSFFDKVLVNAEDEAIRRNRFNLLLSLYEEFIKIADFSELQSANLPS
jgi:glycyl-tRNA synthetase beta chain